MEPIVKHCRCLDVVRNKQAKEFDRYCMYDMITDELHWYYFLDLKKKLREGALLVSNVSLSKNNKIIFDEVVSHSDEQQGLKRVDQSRLNVCGQLITAFKNKFVEYSVPIDEDKISLSIVQTEQWCNGYHGNNVLDGNIDDVYVDGDYIIVAAIEDVFAPMVVAKYFSFDDRIEARILCDSETEVNRFFEKTIAFFRSESHHREDGSVLYSVSAKRSEVKTVVKKIMNLELKCRGSKIGIE